MKNTNTKLETTMTKTIKTTFAVLGFATVAVVGALVGLPTLASLFVACVVAGAIQNS